MTSPFNPPSPPIIELRQYTLHPGQRDVLIELFEREFIESQEALGIMVLGTFRDLDRPDRFVWIRGFRDMGATLRLFNPGTRNWTIYWMDGRDPRLDPPMVGRFQDGRGLFFGDDTFEGKPIRVRFIWSPMTATTCRWEQAFSVDGGKTWETNWMMTFTRTPG